MPFALSTAPVVEPVTTTELKAHLRVDGTDEDTLIASLGVAARQHVEEETRRALVTQTWVLKLDEFPGSGDAEIRLPRPPLQSVTSVQYVDGNGDTQTWSSSLYVVDTADTPGNISLAYGESWPSTRAQKNAVTITYVAGYGAASTVPDALKAAIKLLVGHYYVNREEAVTGTVVARLGAVDALLAPYRVLRLDSWD